MNEARLGGEAGSQATYFAVLRLGEVLPEPGPRRACSMKEARLGPWADSKQGQGLLMDDPPSMQFFFPKQYVP